MVASRRILVVTPDVEKASTLRLWLSRAGYEVGGVPTFSAAKLCLKGLPDLVITDIKLGAYNGLHLAMHAHNAGIPTVAMGTDDPVLVRDAIALQTHWVGATPDAGTLLATVEELIGAGAPNFASELPTSVGSVSWWSIAADQSRSHSYESRPRKRLTQH
jgi:CheY-like chemotaxis protein